MKGNDFMYVKDFKEWALEWFDKFHRASKYIDAVTINQKIIVIDTRTGKTGIAKCHKEDNFSENIGIGIAYAKLKGVQIPQEMPQLKDLPNNTYFTRMSGLKYQKIGMDIETGNIIAKKCSHPSYPSDLTTFFGNTLVEPCKK